MKYFEIREDFFICRNVIGHGQIMFGHGSKIGAAVSSLTSNNHPLSDTRQLPPLFEWPKPALVKNLPILKEFQSGLD